MKKKIRVSYYITVSILALYSLIALTGRWLAQSYPVIYKKDNQWHQSLFKTSHLHFNDVEVFLLPIVPFGPQQTHLKEARLPPLTYSLSVPQHRHWLGTDNLGRDILSGLIHGASVSLWIGFLAVFIAMLLGVPIGISASYWGNSGIKLNIYQWSSLLILGFGLCFFLIFEWPRLSVSEKVVYPILSLILLMISHRLLKKIKSSIKIPLPLDTLVIKIAELRKSFPGLFLLLALTTLFGKTSIYNIVIIIVLLSWIEFARYARAESLSIIHSPFIENSKLLGFKDLYIISRHVLPNMLPVLIVLGSYGVSHAILLESSLSFLGIGMPTEVVTWGKMLSEGRSIQYPWMVIFPGLAIFLLIGTLNSLANFFK